MMNIGFLVPLSRTKTCFIYLWSERL